MVGIVSNVLSGQFSSALCMKHKLLYIFSRFANFPVPCANGMDGSDGGGGAV